MAFWIQMLMTILPLILKWLNGADMSKATQVQKTKLGQIRSYCQQYDNKCDTAGIAAVQLGLQAASPDDDWSNCGPA